MDQLSIDEIKVILDDVSADIKLVADSLGVDPLDLTVRQYSSNGGAYDGRALRRFGGFAAIARGAFAKAGGAAPARVAARRAAALRRAEAVKADEMIVDNDLLTAFKNLWADSAPVIVSKTVKKLSRPSKSTGNRANGVLISDLHLGLNIRSDEVMRNAYNWQIGARRLGKLTEQVSTYKMDHRNACKELHVCLGGDLGQGIIHLSDSNTQVITSQVDGITKYLVQMIDEWRNHYEVINVHCTPDNHLRMVHGQKGLDRAMAQKWDAFSTMIHLGLQMAFRHTNDVKFSIPKTAITTFDVLGHKFGLTHGDTHITSGNVGHSVNVKSITNQLLRLNQAQADRRPYDAFLLGHVHVPLYMHINETNTRLIVNGTGSGTDPYAESIGFFATRPTQVIWETTDDYAVGDFRIVDLSDADDNEDYEYYIKPYNERLMLK